jgi:2-(1,2-epoxy-1,2-dihydrophenyl)acetyl-CoA isomerase
MDDAGTDTEDLLQHLDGGVLTLTLNRPDAGNAVTMEQRERLFTALERASADLNVRAIVLTATGRHFCTGADLSSSRRARPSGRWATWRARCARARNA